MRINRTRSMRQAAIAVVTAGTVGVLAACSGGPNTESAGDVESGNGRYVVALGDSYISGEAGRTVNNGIPNKDGTSKTPGYTTGDASVVYGQHRGAEEIEGCHRSFSAMVNIEDGWQAENLACSGAQTRSFTEDDGSWKPGLDSGKGEKPGQAAMLETFAKDNDVGAVVVSIGGNDMGFSSIVGACVGGFLLKGGSAEGLVDLGFL